MKKLILSLVPLLLLSACGSTSVPAPTIPATGENTVSWQSITFDLLPGWSVVTVDDFVLEASGSNGSMTLEFGRAISNEMIVEEISINDQNYKYLPEDLGLENVLSTSWEKEDLLITTSLELMDVASMLSSFRKPRMSWQGLEFDRPGGLDWAFIQQNGIPRVIFINDDGNNLENETEAPQSLEDLLPRFNIFIMDSPMEVEEKDGQYFYGVEMQVSYFDEVNFDGAEYQVLRAIDDYYGEEIVIYVGKLSNNRYLWIRAPKAFDDDAQDILNEAIGI